MIISNSITHFKLLLPHRIAEETVTDQMKKKKPKQEKKNVRLKRKRRTNRRNFIIRDKRINRFSFFGRSSYIYDNLITLSNSVHQIVVCYVFPTDGLSLFLFEIISYHYWSDKRLFQYKRTHIKQKRCGSFPLKMLFMFIAINSYDQNLANVRQKNQISVGVCELS